MADGERKSSGQSQDRTGSSARQFQIEFFTSLKQNLPTVTRSTLNHCRGLVNTAYPSSVCAQRCGGARAAKYPKRCRTAPQSCRCQSFHPLQEFLTRRVLSRVQSATSPVSSALVAVEPKWLAEVRHPACTLASWCAPAPSATWQARHAGLTGYSRWSCSKR